MAASYNPARECFELNGEGEGEESKLDCNGVVEFCSFVCTLQCFGMGCVYLLVRQLLPTAYTELSAEKVYYLIYNASVLFSSTVQKQYFQKYRNDEILPVAINDLAFSIHAVLMSALTMVQIAIYDRGNQKFSKIAIGIIIVSCLAGAVCACIAIPRHSWLWLLSCFNTMQFVMTVIKYIPQAVLNFQRKSTSGFSIGNVLLDFFGGVSNCLQMLVHSIDQRTLDNIKGNLGKTLLALVSIFFTAIFIIQHYVLYPTKKADSSSSGVANVQLQRDIEAS